MTLAGAIGGYLGVKFDELVTTIVEGVLAAFTSIDTYINETLSPTFETFKSLVLQPLIDGVVSLWTGLKDAVTWFGNLWDKIGEMGGKVWDAIKIFLGHSPSPLEKGLRGIADQMQEMAQFEIPAFSAAMGRVPEPAFAGMAGMGGETTNNWSMNVNTRAETSTMLLDWAALRYLKP